MGRSKSLIIEIESSSYDDAVRDAADRVLLRLMGGRKFMQMGIEPGLNRNMEVVAELTAMVGRRAPRGQAMMYRRQVRLLGSFVKVIGAGGVSG